MIPVPPSATARRAPTARGAGLLVGLLAGVLVVLLGPAPAARALEDTWTARAADATGAAQLAGGGRGVTVAVLDSWIDRGHPDFRGHVTTGATCQGGTCRDGGSDVPDACEAHGTHVAGLVGSSRFGIAPEARILPVRVLTERNGACQAQANDVAQGIRWATSHDAQIINVSLGSTYALTDADRVIPRAVAEASRRGIVVVVAAGNGKTAGSDVYGADALVVAATAPNNTLASYSQRGAGVDLAAPGGQPRGNGCTPDDCVVSTWSDRSYAADAGTSMAAPLVSGTAALLLSQQPARSRDDVVATLERTARPLAGAGAGRLDILAAVGGKSVGGGTDAVPAASLPVVSAPSGPTAADDPAVARVIRPDGSVATAPPTSTVADRSGESQVNRPLLWTGAALVGLVLVAVVVVARTQGLMRPAYAGGVPTDDQLDADEEEAVAPSEYAYEDEYVYVYADDEEYDEGAYEDSPDEDRYQEGEVYRR